MIQTRFSLASMILVLAILIRGPVSASASVIDGAKKEGTVIFYNSMNASHHEKIVEAFEEKYPFIKVEGFRANSLKIVNRILSEARAGRHLVDVVNTDSLNGWVLKEKDLLQPYKSEEANAFPEEFQDREGYFLCCTYMLTNVLGYNTDLVEPEGAPKTYEDLLMPKWKGQLGMEIDLAKLFAVFVDIWGKEKTVGYFEALMKQQPSLRRGRSVLGQLLAVGEFSAVIGLYGYRVLEMQELGAPLEIVQADPVVGWPWRLLTAKHARHPNAAKLLIDFILSREGQQVMADMGRTVVRPGVKGRFPRLTEGVKLHVVRPDVAMHYEERSKIYYEIVNK